MSKCAVHAEALKFGHERFDTLGPGRLIGAERRRVEGYDVDMRLQALGDRRQFPGLIERVIDLIDEGPFERHPPTLDVEVVGRRGLHGCNGIPLIQWYERGAQLVVGGMQTYGQGDLPWFLGKSHHPRYDPDRRHGHRPGAKPPDFDDPTKRLAHAPVVGERLTHAHVDDVGQMVRAARESDRREVSSRVGNLGVDFTRFKMPVKAELAGSAEGTAECTASLAGDAQRVSFWVTHQHRFDGVAVWSPE